MDAAPPPDVVRRSLASRVGAVSPVLWLAVAIAVYFGVSLAFSGLRAMDLTTSTWDMGIYQQALWSTAHGRPFWEAADAETGSYGSLLQVHSVFLLYLIVPVYAAAPSEWTLFIIQSAVVALAAVPLFLLGRDLTSSGRWGLAAAVVYLAWAPLLSANLYDFHAEAFLPIELFTFVLLWNRSRYAGGVVVALVAFATFELAPILLCFAGVFFLLPSREQWQAGIARLRGAMSSSRVRGNLNAELRRFFLQRRVIATLALLVLCVAAYLFLVALREQYLASWFGFPPFPSTPSGYVVGTTAAGLGLAWSNLFSGLTMKVTAWVVFFALLGFVPLLAPRALVLALPWMIFSFFSANLNYVVFGFQYGFIEASALLVAFTYGLVPIQRWVARRDESALSGATSPTPRSGEPPRASSRARRSHAATLVAVALVALIALNVAASPLDPMLDNIGLGAAYRISLAGEAGFANAEGVAALVPADATVLASDNLFPLVDDDLNAYSLLWMADPTLELPFSATNLPSYVLIAQPGTNAVPPWLTATLYNVSDYGVRGVAWSSPAGTVLLFQHGFTGTADAFGASPSSGGAYYGAELEPGKDGYVTTLPSTVYPTVVVSSPEANGSIWNGPMSNIAAGNYTADLFLKAWATNPAQAPGPNQGVLALRYGGFGQSLVLERTLLFSDLNSSAWTLEQFSFTVSEPVIEFEVRGLSRTPTATVAVEYLSIEPAA
jgi:uncharacterized membrane protein